MKIRERVSKARRKKRIFYGQADREGGSAPSALTNVKILILFSLKFDSLTLTTHFISLSRV